MTTTCLSKERSKLQRVREDLTSYVHAAGSGQGLLAGVYSAKTQLSPPSCCSQGALNTSILPCGRGFAGKCLPHRSLKPPVAAHG